MKLATFLAGMVASTALVTGVALTAELPMAAVIGLAVATVVLAQVLYLALILLLTRSERQRRVAEESTDAQNAPTAVELVIAGRHRESRRG